MNFQDIIDFNLGTIFKTFLAFVIYLYINNIIITIVYN